MPPVRTRSEDIEILAQLFTNERADSLNITFGGFTEDAIEMLKSYEWPGNVRELKNLMESLIVLEKGKVISGKVLEKYLSLDVNIPSFASENLPVHLEKSAATAERELIIRTLFLLRSDITEIKEMLSNRLLLPTTFNQNKTSGMPFSKTMEEATIVSEPKEVGNISMQEMEKELIRSTLEKFYGNRRKTAEALEISERTLYRKIKDYEI